jgi:uncharacterized coiled-coil protein SlyX
MPRLVVGPAPTITTNNVAINKLNKQIGDAKEFAETTAAKIEELTQQLLAMRSKPIRMTPLEKFDGTRSKLKSFLAGAAIHLDVNTGKLLDNTSKVLFVAAYFTGQAIE